MKILMQLVDQYAEIQRKIGNPATDMYELLEAAEQLYEAIERRAEYLAAGAEYRAALGAVRNLKVGPPGAVFAMENLKNAEKNAKDPSYVPSWNPGKRMEKEEGSDEAFETFLRNPLFTDEQREQYRREFLNKG